MIRFLEEIRGAKKLEWFLLIAAVAIVLLIGFRESDAPSAARTESEKRLISALSRIEGVGNADALISEVGERTGVLIIAEGVEDINVYLHIQQAVQKIIGIELSDIEIVPHEG